MSGDSHLLLEKVILPGNARAFGKLIDLSMLVPGEQERTEVEYRTLLVAAGLELTRIIPTQCPISVVEAMPP